MKCNFIKSRTSGQEVYDPKKHIGFTREEFENSYKDLKLIFIKTNKKTGKKEFVEGQLQEDRSNEIKKVEHGT